MGDPASFHYLNQSGCISLDAIDDAKEYLDTRRAMEIVGINSDEQVQFCAGFVQFIYSTHMQHFMSLKLSKQP